MLTFKCSSCEVGYCIPEEMAGRTMKCQNCGVPSMVAKTGKTTFVPAMKVKKEKFLDPLLETEPLPDERKPRPVSQAGSSGFDPKAFAGLCRTVGFFITIPSLIGVMMFANTSYGEENIKYCWSCFKFGFIPLFGGYLIGAIYDATRPGRRD